MNIVVDGREAIATTDSEGGFHVEIIGIRGGYGYGDTLDEAIANASETTKEFFKPLPLKLADYDAEGGT